MRLYKLGGEYLHYLQYELRFKDIQKRRDRFWRIAHFWGNIRIKSLRLEHISKLKESYVRQNLTPAYINANLFVIRSFLRWCLEVRNISALEPTRIKTVKNPFKKVSYLSKEQVKIMLGAINTKHKYGVQCMAMILCLLSSGVRRSELVSLNRNSIHIKSGTAFITGKGGKNRMIIFKPWALKWVKLHLKNRTDTNEALFIAFSSNQKNGQCARLKPGGLNHYLQEISKKVGFKITPHEIRRTAATLLQFEGMELYDVKTFLGHENIATTQKYLGVNFESFKKNYKKFMKISLNSAKIFEKKITPKILLTT